MASEIKPGQDDRLTPAERRVIEAAKAWRDADIENGPSSVLAAISEMVNAIDDLRAEEAL